MLRSITFVACLLAGTAPVSASDVPLYRPAPEWVKQAPTPDPANLPSPRPQFLILDQQQRIEDGGVASYVRSAVQIANAAMLNEAGTFSVDWLPDHGDVIVHHARILRAGDTIDLLAKGERLNVLKRELGLEQRMLTGILTATMEIEGLRVNDVLDIAFTVTNRDPALGGRVHSAMPVIARPVTAGLARNRILWSSADGVALRSHLDGVTLTPRQSGSFSEVEFVGPAPKPAEIPGDAPPRFRPLPMIEVSNFGDWATVSRTFAPLYATQGLIAAGSPLAAEVARIRAAATTPRERAALALQSVQAEIRYLFRGMAGGNYTPQAPARTWEVRYGDCKAKTLLLLAMLHALEIEAEPVLASIEGGDLVPKRLPGAGAFDHVLVRASIDGTDLWLDGTGQGARLADIEDTPPFRHVLPLRSAGAALMPLPIRAPARPDIAIDLELDQSAALSLPAVYTLRMTARGQGAEMLRMANTQGTEDQREAMAQEIVGQYLPRARVVSHGISFDDAATTGTLEIEGIAQVDWSREAGRHQRTLDFAVGKAAFAPDRTRSSWKAIPVATAGPTSFAFRARTLLPDNGRGYVIEGDRTLPERLGGMKVSRSVALDQGVATVEDRIVATGIEIAPGEIAAERATLAAAEGRLLTVKAPADLPLRHVERAKARDTGKLKRLDAAYARIVADGSEDDDASAFENRARYRELLGDFEGSLADIDRAIAIDASRSSLHYRAYLLYVLRRDAQSLETIARAHETEPADFDTLAYYTNRLSDAGRHDEALELIEARVAAGGEEKAAALSHKASLLAMMGEADAAITAIDSAVEVDPRDAHMLNNRCWLRGQLGIGLDAAQADCDRAIAMGSNPASALDSRALIHLRAGRLAEARADLDEALTIAPEMQAARYLRGIVRHKSGDAKGGAADIADAVAMAPRIADDYTRWGIKP
ncbi:DUF3857 domain-containing protein [Sphingomonas baiyangensis]|uniref:DUF3857 domain-containing protein n=1 Tax=Sphingomonas baiyangensis TaxID=2572576 RepID=A0A4U1L883_9SPHN|nr:DUF3857 domain-containing protein [Sphingomonas baiyangensis]TKD53159.1 DUF3857 domain-containing protein [Sphingomonas baiyangensis]